MLNGSSAVTNQPQDPQATSTNHSKEAKISDSKSTENKPTASTSSQDNDQKASSSPSTKRTKHSIVKIPKNRVMYISSNYRNPEDPNFVGNLIQKELIELRKQSENIKSASDLTESQAHVVKRQITRLQGAATGAPTHKHRPQKKYRTTLSQATNELMKLMQKKQAMMVIKKKAS